MINLDIQFSNIIDKYNKIENSLNSMENIATEDLIKLNREYAELKPIVEKIAEYRKEQKEILNLNELVKDADDEIKKIAETELIEKKVLLKDLHNEMLRLLIPKDVNDTKNSILEIRAGTGGDEASLFTSDLLSMYQKFADQNS